MRLLLRHKLLIGGVTLVAAASGGGAYAATQSGTNSRQAFLNDVAKRLNVSPAALSSAVKAALIDRLNAAVKAGEITHAQANQIERRINQNRRLPLFFAPGGRLGAGPGVLVRGGGTFRVAASYLGLTNAQLLSDLRSGRSLAQIAKARGKSASGLEQAIIAAETTRLNRLQSKGVITKAQEQRLLSALSARISALINRAGFGRGPGFGRGLGLGRGWIAGGPRLVSPGGPPVQGGPMVPPAIAPGGDGPPPPSA